MEAVQEIEKRLHRFLVIFLAIATSEFINITCGCNAIEYTGIVDRRILSSNNLDCFLRNKTA